MTPLVTILRPPLLRQLQQTFIQEILPRVEAHGRVYFRHVRCPHLQQELLAEMLALCWKWFITLVRRGKDVLQFVSALASYAARAVANGRRLCGQEKAKEVLSRRAQRQHDFTVSRLPDYSTLHGSPLEEALRDNTVSPVPEQVAFKIDFPAWRLTYANRDRRLIDQLMMGEGTLTVSRSLGLSPSRISQKRRQFHADWLAFCGEGER